MPPLHFAVWPRSNLPFSLTDNSTVIICFGLSGQNPLNLMIRSRTFRLEDINGTLWVVFIQVTLMVLIGFNY
jgi:hypothetical protein